MPKQHKASRASFVILNSPYFCRLSGKFDRQKLTTHRLGILRRLPIVILIMPYVEKRIKRYFCAVFGAFNSTPAICSGAITHSRNSYTTHKFQEPAKPCYQPILPQTPVNTQHNRGLFGVSFAAINPQSTVSAQANRGFSAPTFEAIGGAV